MYLNVPRGYEELVKAMRQDDRLRLNFFSRLRLLFYAAAALSQHVLDELDALAVETCGERMFMMTGLGATETAPMAICRTWESPLAGAIGLPIPQVEAKLVPTGDKLEIRVRGPNVTPGYWRQDDLTRAAFDDEGFYRIGDAVRFVDAGDVNAGFAFDGRLAEDFKLATGTWVNVGVLRARAILHFAPCLRDFVVTGHDRGEIGVEASPLRHAPHTVRDLIEPWDRAYPRSAAIPQGPSGVPKQYWPPVNRVDQGYGDRNLVCSCPPMEQYSKAAE